jgi:hypothetical protein
MATNLPATISISEALVRAIAMDIGKAVVHHIETMYPAAIEATPKSTFGLSVRNTVYNEIVDAIKVTDESEIKERLARRKSQRRKSKAVWRNIRTHGR